MSVGRSPKRPSIPIIANLPVNCNLLRSFKNYRPWALTQLPSLSSPGLEHHSWVGTLIPGSSCPLSSGCDLTTLPEAS